MRGNQLASIIYLHADDLVKRDKLVQETETVVGAGSLSKKITGGVSLSVISLAFDRSKDNLFTQEGKQNK